MAPAMCADPAPVPPPSYRRTVAVTLHLDALTLVRRLHLLASCRRAVQLAQQQCPPVFGWSATLTRVALTYATVWVIAVAAYQAERPELIRSPRLVLAHVWEGVEL
jgi:hypothetical protein